MFGRRESGSRNYQFKLDSLPYKNKKPLNPNKALQNFLQVLTVVIGEDFCFHFVLETCTAFTQSRCPRDHVERVCKGSCLLSLVLKTW